jgi:hypothetical protein
VHVLQLFSGETFDFSLPTGAFKGKGLDVNRIEKPGEPLQFARWLENAEQLWIISDVREHLQAEHVAIIKRKWLSGMGLYLWGTRLFCV